MRLTTQASNVSASKSIDVPAAREHVFDCGVHTDVMNGRASIDRSLLAWADHRDLWQGVLNECFIPERVVEQAWRGSDTVIAQVEWELDGLEEIETTVLAKAGDLRLVQLIDDRRFIKTLWLYRDHIREVSRDELRP